MLLEIDPHSGVPIYRQIMEQITRRIMSGQLVGGQKLPAVRQLAAELKVNPMTISKVYSYLELEGFAVRRRGVGLFVADIAGDRKQDNARQMLLESVRKTVSLAVELGVPEAQALAMFEQVLDHQGGQSKKNK